MKRLIAIALGLAALFAAPATALAQCTGQPLANTICAGPTSGGAGLPSYRTLVNADLPSSFAITATSVTIAPSANTNNAGLTITQSGPTSGSVAGPVNLNLINVTSYNAATNAGTNFADFGAWSSAIVASRVNFTLGGANLGSSVNQSEPFMAFMGHLRLTTATTSAVGGDFEGVTGATYVNVSAPNANMEGVVGFAVVDSGATIASITGVFAEVDIINGGTVASRRGVTISSLSTSTATGAIDAAIVLGASNSAGGFKAYTYFNQGAGGAPIQSTGDIFVSSGSMTVANVFNASNWTVTGDYFLFPNFLVQGTNGFTNIGNAVAPDAALTINLNSAASSSAPASNNMAHIVAANSTLAGLEVDTYASFAAYVGRRADGTQASKSAVAANSQVLTFLGVAWDGSAYNTAASALLETWNAQGAGDHSAGFVFRTTPASSTTIQSSVAMMPSGGLVVGSSNINATFNLTTDPGNGGILGTDLYSNDASFLIRTKATLNNGAAANTGTLTNAPAAGNPTKWVSIDDNGTTRKVPSW